MWTVALLLAAQRRRLPKVSFCIASVGSAGNVVAESGQQGLSTRA